MSTTITLSENELIQENADYVLGMYDMYENDQEIIDMLKLKGLEASIIEKVLFEIKKPAYEKRIRQSKRMMITGAAILIILVIIPFLYIKLNNQANTVQPEQVYNEHKAEIYRIAMKRPGEDAIAKVFMSLINICIYVILAGVSQLFYGTFLFFKYNRLLRRV